MTKQEAIELVENTAPFATSPKPFALAIVKTIYEYRKDEVCENCKHSKMRQDKNIGFCSNPSVKTIAIDLGIFMPMSIMNEFGCNKFEPKE